MLLFVHDSTAHVTRQNGQVLPSHAGIELEGGSEGVAKRNNKKIATQEKLEQQQKFSDIACYVLHASLCVYIDIDIYL